MCVCVYVYKTYSTMSCNEDQGTGTALPREGITPIIIHSSRFTSADQLLKDSSATHQDGAGDAFVCMSTLAGTTKAQMGLSGKLHVVVQAGSMPVGPPCSSTRRRRARVVS